METTETAKSWRKLLSEPECGMLSDGCAANFAMLKHVVLSSSRNVRTLPNMIGSYMVFGARACADLCLERGDLTKA